MYVCMYVCMYVHTYTHIIPQPFSDAITELESSLRYGP